MGRLVWGLALALCALLGNSARAQVVFADDFDHGASAAWTNQSGGWFAAGGVYRASAPSNNPMSYSGVASLTNLTDFTVDVDVHRWIDGGVYLRSSDHGGSISGVLLVTGGMGQSYSGLYWHVIQNNSFSGALNQASVPGLLGSDAHLTLRVVGNTYQAFVNGSLQSTLVTSQFAQGGVALYQFAPDQAFDNFQVMATVSEPDAYWMGIAGLGLMLAVARRRLLDRSV